jgi:hypothetical protein
MGKQKSASKKATKHKLTQPPGITLSPEYFALLWEYFDRKHGFTDPIEMAQTLALGDRLWATLREAAREQGCALPIRHDPLAGAAALPPPGACHLRLVP